MYRCGVCGSCSKPGESRKVHVVEREVPKVARGDSVGTRPGWQTDRQVGTRREIECEVALCSECHFRLARGATLDQLIRERRALETTSGEVNPPPVVVPPPVVQAGPVAGGKSITRRSV